jgi:hypothetical protein
MPFACVRLSFPSGCTLDALAIASVVFRVLSFPIILTVHIAEPSSRVDLRLQTLIIGNRDGQFEARESRTNVQTSDIQTPRTIPV